MAKTVFLFIHFFGGGEDFNQNVPIEVWNQFKKSESKELFYDQTIRSIYTGIIMRDIKK